MNEAVTGGAGPTKVLIGSGLGLMMPQSMPPRNLKNYDVNNRLVDADAFEPLLKSANLNAVEENTVSFHLTPLHFKVSLSHLGISCFIYREFFPFLLVIFNGFI